MHQPTLTGFYKPLTLYDEKRNAIMPPDNALSFVSDVPNIKLHLAYGENDHDNIVGDALELLKYAKSLWPR